MKKTTSASSKDLSPSFWEQHYTDGHTPWDIGNVSPPIREYVDRIGDKSLRILIPGAGHAHEAAYLHRQGFGNVWVCDWAPSAFKGLLEQAPGFPKEHLIVSDFFALDMPFDLLIEQTFFCAIDPAQRPDYARQAARLLKPGGTLAGLLFAEPFEQEGPPFGGTAQEYEAYFAPFFHIERMELCDTSIKPRLGRELFIELQVASFEP
jgi:SAM-dependent methyltransferase